MVLPNHLDHPRRLSSSRYALSGKVMACNTSQDVHIQVMRSILSASFNDLRAVQMIRPYSSDKDAGLPCQGIQIFFVQLRNLNA